MIFFSSPFYINTHSKELTPFFCSSLSFSAKNSSSYYFFHCRKYFLIDKIFLCQIILTLIINSNGDFSLSFGLPSLRSKRKKSFSQPLAEVAAQINCFLKGFKLLRRFSAIESIFSFPLLNFFIDRNSSTFFPFIVFNILVYKYILACYQHPLIR